MNTSPITSWEGAEAYFTFGANSVGVWVSIVASIGILVWLIATMIRHENQSFAKIIEANPLMEEKISNSIEMQASKKEPFSEPVMKNASELG